MSELRVTVRLDAELMRALGDEAKKRKQTVSALCRTFIQDGVVHYNEINERIIRNEETMIETLAELRSLTGAVLQLSLEQKTLLNKKKPEEPETDYVARLGKIFNFYLSSAMDKGDSLLKSIREKSKK